MGRHLERRHAASPERQRHLGSPGRPRPKFGTDVNGVVSAFISGWQFSGIYTYQSGFPIGFGNIIFTGDFDDIALPAERADAWRAWFNTDAGFNKVSTQQLGSNVRTFPLRLENVRTDNVNNIDLSLIKNTQIAGRRSSSGSTR